MDFSSVSKKPYIITVACTKGGSAKSTNAANIGAFCADHGLRTLLMLYPCAQSWRMLQH